MNWIAAFSFLYLIGWNVNMNVKMAANWDKYLKSALYVLSTLLKANQYSLYYRVCQPRSKIPLMCSFKLRFDQYLFAQHRFYDTKSNRKRWKVSIIVLFNTSYCISWCIRWNICIKLFSSNRHLTLGSLRKMLKIFLLHGNFALKIETPANIYDVGAIYFSIAMWRVCALCIIW